MKVVFSKKTYGIIKDIIKKYGNSTIYILTDIDVQLYYYCYYIITLRKERKERGRKGCLWHKKIDIGAENRKINL